MQPASCTASSFHVWIQAQCSLHADAALVNKSILITVARQYCLAMLK
jgi:hypothetical protein